MQLAHSIISVLSHSIFSFTDIIFVEGALRGFYHVFFGEGASFVMSRTQYSSAVAAFSPVTAWTKGSVNGIGSENLVQK